MNQVKIKVSLMDDSAVVVWQAMIQAKTLKIQLLGAVVDPYLL